MDVSRVAAWEGERRKIMFLGLTVKGIIIHAISKVLRNFLWSGQEFKTQQCCNHPTDPRTEDLFLLISLVVLDGTVIHPSSMLSYTVTEGRQHYQISLCVSHLYMLPVVLSGLSESLKSRCFSAQQKMPENTKGKGKADLVKARFNHLAALTYICSWFSQGMEHCGQLWAKQRMLLKMEKLLWI